MEYWLNQKIKLGKTELNAGRLGIGAAYGAPPEALEAAFEAGCNYFYWGALRNSKMATAIRNIVNKGRSKYTLLHCPIFGEMFTWERILQEF